MEYLIFSLMIMLVRLSLDLRAGLGCVFGRRFVGGMSFKVAGRSSLTTFLWEYVVESGRGANLIQRGLFHAY